MTAAPTKALFAAPCFTGCISWDRPIQVGAHVYHRALYWVPMLIYYSGARRGEICGLLVDDVLMGGNIPYLSLVPNKYRRLKNAQSQRNIPIHPELIRLGFSDYAEAVRALGYDLLFADPYSPTSRSPLGDRLYDELKPVLRVADIAVRPLMQLFTRRGPVWEFADRIQIKVACSEHVAAHWFSRSRLADRCAIPSD
jgi:integrase